MSTVTEAVMALPAAKEDLRLGGANALGEFYLGHRLSVDLDFFAMEPDRVAAVSRELPAGLTATGVVAGVRSVVTGIDFHRFSLQPIEGGDELTVDLGRWMPPQIRPPTVVDGIRVESFTELAVGKLLALIDRGEAKDVLDLWVICHRGGATLHELVDLVFLKDPGLESAPWAIANRLSQVGRRIPGPFPPSFDLVDPGEVRSWFAEQAVAMWRRIRPEPVNEA